MNIKDDHKIRDDLVDCFSYVQLLRPRILSLRRTTNLSRRFADVVVEGSRVPNHPEVSVTTWCNDHQLTRHDAGMNKDVAAMRKLL